MGQAVMKLGMTSAESPSGTAAAGAVAVSTEKGEGIAAGKRGKNRLMLLLLSQQLVLLRCRQSAPLVLFVGLLARLIWCWCRMR